MSKFKTDPRDSAFRRTVTGAEPAPASAHEGIDCRRQVKARLRLDEWNDVTSCTVSVYSASKLEDDLDLWREYTITATDRAFETFLDISADERLSARVTTLAGGGAESVRLTWALCESGV